MITHTWYILRMAGDILFALVFKWRDTTVRCSAWRGDIHVYPESKARGANMGHIWGRQDPSGPHVGPMNLVIWVVSGLHMSYFYCHASISTMDTTKLYCGYLSKLLHNSWRYVDSFSLLALSRLYRQFMMTSSNGSIFRVTGHLCGEFPAQRPVTRSFDVFFDLSLNKRLREQWGSWWFETPSCPYDVTVMSHYIHVVYFPKNNQLPPW